MDKIIKILLIPFSSILFLISLFPGSVLGDECPPYFVPAQSESTDQTSNRNLKKEDDTLICRYNGPYPMVQRGMENWRNVPYIPFLDKGIPLPFMRLGEQLFFDRLLSIEGNLSCGDCHMPSKAFTDQQDLARGRSQTTLKRNTPTLINIIFQKRFFWDGRTYSLLDQAFEPLFAKDEMGLSPELLLERIKSNAGLLEKVQKISHHHDFEAFYSAVENFYKTPRPNINQDRLFSSPNRAYSLQDQAILKTIALSLVSYQATLLSFNSPFDQWFLGQEHALTEAEIRGFNVFRSFVTRCAECHIPPLFTSGEFAAIGAPDHPQRRDDPGEYHQNPHPLLKKSFKIPTLRNIALTAPYMHSGSLKRLEDVIAFYRNGEGRSLPKNLIPGLHWHIRPLEISQGEANDLEKFLETLTDSKYDLKRNPL